MESVIRVRPRRDGKRVEMDKFGVQLSLESVAEAKGKWAEAVTTFNEEVESVMTRLIHEAAALRMSAEQVSQYSGYTPKRVRAMMRKIGLNPRDGKILLSKKAAEVLHENAELLGIAPNAMDLTSPLAYLPMGSELRQAIIDQSISQVTELDNEPYGEHTAFYEEHYSDWKVHAISLRVCIPTRTDMPREEALELVQDALDEAALDIKVTVQP